VPNVEHLNKNNILDEDNDIGCDAPEDDI